MGSLTNNIHETIELLKDSPILGCITGSCLNEADFDTWDAEPDVDVFVYSEQALIHAITWLHENGFVFGTKDVRTNEGEKWKFDKLLKGKLKKKGHVVTTLKMNNASTVVNVTWHEGRDTALDVISNFDMSIIMHAWDIQKAMDLDLREMFGQSKMVAVPNPFRPQDCEAYTIREWIRQFDRVVKYWSRGYDTRPMAKFYIDMIDKFLARDALFTSEAAVDYYEEAVAEFKDQRELMVTWYNSVKED